jgi:hypothetical protein
MLGGFYFFYRSSKRQISLRHTPTGSQTVNLSRRSLLRRGAVHLLWAFIMAILVGPIVAWGKGQVVEQIRALRHEIAPHASSGTVVRNL